MQTYYSAIGKAKICTCWSVLRAWALMMIGAETVYIAQLHRRALILNLAFQDSLAQTVTDNAFVPEIGNAVEELEKLLQSVNRTLAGAAVLTTVTSERGLEVSQALKPDNMETTESVSKESATTSKILNKSSTNVFEETTSNLVSVDYQFMRNGQQSRVQIMLAPIKKKAQMREKFNKYVLPNPRCEWPLTAYIADPFAFPSCATDPPKCLRWCSGS